MEPTFTAVTFAGFARGSPESLVRYRAGSHMGMIAEGSGSFSGGGLAAELAVDLLPLALSAPSNASQLDRWNDAATRVHESIRRAAQVDRFYRGMTSTFAACQFDGQHVVTGSVGTCRVYRLRNGEFTRVTKEPEPGVSRAAGGDGQLKVDLIRFAPQDGDVVLMCTMRTYKSIHESLIHELLLQERLEPHVAAREIANATAGDDVAVVVGRVDRREGRRGSSGAAVIVDD